MKYYIGEFILRPPEPTDIDMLYSYKNDPEISQFLSGFSTGYSRADLNDWLGFHRQQRDEALWVITEAATDRCIGHMGFYQIDFRVRSAEFAILIGDRAFWGKGLGSACLKFAIDYGFKELNLNRIHISLLSTHERAFNLYKSHGFKEEGRIRQAKFKEGRYVDMIVMGLLREEYSSTSTPSSGDSP